MSPDVLKGALERVPRWVVWVVAPLVAVVLVAVVVAVVFASRPGFLASYHRFEKSYSTLQSSVHRDLACDQCHVDGRIAPVREAARVGDFYRGLVRRPDEPLFSRMTTPTSDACLECHLWDWSDDASRTLKVPHPAHLRVAAETRECVSCHKWTAHEEEYIEKHKKMPFSSVCASFECHVGTKKQDECFSCHHVLQESEGEWTRIHEKTVRAKGPNGCLEKCHDSDQCRLCHTTGKRPVFSSSLATAGVKAIERQHIKPDWMAKHGAVALADRSKCLICHVSTGECDDCHARRPAFHGPKATWLNRHKDFAKNERRCLACHKKAWCEECHKQFKEMR